MKGGDYMFTVTINNMPNVEPEKYVVARYCDGEWWYYGMYDNKEKAYAVSEEVGGYVFEYIKE